MTIQDELVWWSDCMGYVEIQMSREDASSVSLPGKDAKEDIKALRRTNKALSDQLEALNPVKVRKALKEYGAWASAELADHDANLMRLVWLAGGDISDGQCDPEEED